MAIEQEANAKTCASLVLRLYCQQIQWSQAAGDGERLGRPPGDFSLTAGNAARRLSGLA